MPTENDYPGLGISEQEAMRKFIDQHWPNGVVCPFCSFEDHYFIESRKAFECKDCGEQFYITHGTAFAWTKLPFSKIIVAQELFGRGLSALQISKALPCQYPTAWKLVDRIRISQTAK